MRTPATAMASLLFAAGLIAPDTAAGQHSQTDIITPPTAAGSAAREAVKAAVALLPKAPARIAVMDITSASPEVQRHLRRLDAFTVRGNDVIYLVDGSELLIGAQKGYAFHRAALAAVIWHEMAHLEGADERDARKAEAALWTRFVRDGLTDSVTALRYLRALEMRPDHSRLASR